MLCRPRPLVRQRTWPRCSHRHSGRANSDAYPAPPQEEVKKTGHPPFKVKKLQLTPSEVKEEAHRRSMMSAVAKAFEDPETSMRADPSMYQPGDELVEELSEEMTREEVERTAVVAAWAEQHGVPLLRSDSQMSNAYSPRAPASSDSAPKYSLLSCSFVPRGSPGQRSGRPDRKSKQS